MAAAVTTRWRIRARLKLESAPHLFTGGNHSPLEGVVETAPLTRGLGGSEGNNASPAPLAIPQLKTNPLSPLVRGVKATPSARAFSTAPHCSGLTTHLPALARPAKPWRACRLHHGPRHEKGLDADGLAERKQKRFGRSRPALRIRIGKNHETTPLHQSTTASPRNTQSHPQ